MEWSEEWLAQMEDRALEDRDISLEEIPDLDLYMDQIITLFESKLAGNKRHSEDKLLTKTMINNYSKEGLLRAIKGKKYSKEHIVQILLIYHLKQLLSIQDVKSVLQAAGENQDLMGLYNRHLAFKDKLRDSIPSILERMLRDDLSDLDEDSRRILLVLSLSSMGNYMKRLSEAIIDSSFSGGKP